MQTHSSYRLALLATSVLGLVVVTSQASAQTAPCVLEYRRADNMWANWGRPDGMLGAETITLQPGQKKVFATDWSYEKQRNDGTNFYGSHLRRAVNTGAGQVQIKVRGPASMFAYTKSLVTLAANTLQSNLFGTKGGVLVSLALGSSPTFQSGDSALFRHDLAEVSCPAATTPVASVAPPPAPPVVLSLTGARTTTASTVTVTAVDATSGAALTGQVTINGASGELGKEIAFTPCSETFEYQDFRGATRSRTVRGPCEGIVKIGGYPDTSFNF